MATCPDELLRDALEQISEDTPGSVEKMDRLLADYPLDPRLHFLHGSLLAGARHYGPAQAAMARAVEIAPDFAIARFQLGFLAFTSGDPATASATWAPLLEHDPDDPLRLFVEGLHRLAVDDFAGAASYLRRGIAANTLNPVLNRDMALLLEGMPQVGTPASGDEGEEEPLSLTQLALQQSAARKKLH
jgi:Flp pilus assembly protein TadD